MITNLSLTNFRSYADRQIELDPRITVVVGPNATGKTNLLEAVYVLATTRSFRAKDPELIHHGEGFFRLVATTGDGELALAFQQNESGREKRAQLDGSKQTLVQHLAHLQTVLFEPNDLQLILGSPDRRRRYLDFILAQTNPQYLSTMHRYRRVLQQRNRLLSDWRGETSELFAWNVKLSELAADIDAQRQQLVNFINSVAEEIYASIAGSKEQLSLAYRSSINASGTKDHTDHTDDDTNSAAQNFESLFLQQLESNIHRDIGAGFTTIGPHRDDFEITFKNSMVTAVASRGEMRTIVLVLKLAEITYIEDKNQQPPILLLDDVFSELDQTRRTFLIKTLDKYQSIITTTDADMARQLGSSHVIETAPETTPKGTDKPTTSLKNNRKAT